MVCALYQTPPCDNLFLVYYMNEFPLFFCCVFLSMEITPVEDVNMGGGKHEDDRSETLGIFGERMTNVFKFQENK